MLKRAADGSTELDLSALLKVLWNRIWAIIIVAVIGGAAAFCYAKFAITPQYQSSVMMYVNNRGVGGTTTYQISTTELTAAKSLVNTYLVVLNSRTCLNEVSEKSGTGYSYRTLSGMIDATAVNDTEIFRITVTSTSAEEAQLIANTIADVLPSKISDIVEGSSVKVVDYAPLLPNKTYPSNAKFTLLGLLAGAVLSIAVIFVLQLMDDLIHNEEYLTNTFEGIPVLAAIPDLMEHSEKSYYYRRSERRETISHSQAAARAESAAQRADEEAMKRGGRS